MGRRSSRRRWTTTASSSSSSDPTRPDAVDPTVRRLLRHLGGGPARRLGRGGEATVWSLDADRVVRVLHAGSGRRALDRRRRVLERLDSTPAPFALPEILDVGEYGDRAYAVERRLPGTSVAERLETLRPGRARERLVESHLEAAAAIRTVGVEAEPWCGELMAEDPVRADGWRDWLVERAEASLARSAAPRPDVDPVELVDGLPTADRRALVHLDAWVANMLTDGDRITAIVDVGDTATLGNPDLDVLAAVVYLEAPAITPWADERDRALARAWLAGRGLDEAHEPARRWLAVYWWWATDDRRLHAWCRSVLG